jgi:A/G-specific adenine glycosylase
MAARNPKSSRLVERLLEWFARNARDLPWRRTRDPYAIWVSEVMLQQTQVKTVIPYWQRWMRALPTIAAVARANSDKIHKLWEGLGYYTRARNLQTAARQIVARHGGKFPENFDAVLALPGIGRYTTGAICSIAFNQPVPILDGNVIRVLTRVFGIGENPRDKKTNALLWKIAENLVSHAKTQSAQRRGRDSALRCPDAAAQRPHLNSCSLLNQSLMELGALVCTPRNPQCQICPVKKLCVASREDRVGKLPNLGRRPAVTPRHFMAFAIEHDGRFLVRQRPAGVVNAHLWEFPNIEIGPRLSEPQRVRLPNGTGIFSATDGRRTCCGSRDPRFASVADVAAQTLGHRPKQLTPLCTVKHFITRYRITLEAFFAQTGGSSRVRSKKVKKTRRRTPPSETGVWKTPAQMQRLAFTSAHRKILERLT